ncbi:MAG: SpoIIE family protein phosphatase [Spirochaetota bacterium]
MAHSHILVIDDDITTLELIKKFFSKDNFLLTVATSAEEGLEKLQNTDIKIVICDWILPGMSGPELFTKIRSKPTSTPPYLILITSKNTKEEITYAFNNGADDFISKPFDYAELLAKIQVGQRNIQLQENLHNKNQLLEKRNKTLAEAYVKIRNDLQTAVFFQQSALPQNTILKSSIEFASLYIISEYTSGDSYNFFLLDENKIGFYLLDVCGHGVSAAMISYALNQALNPAPIPNSLLKDYQPETDSFIPLSAAEALARINQYYQIHSDIIGFFTITYGIYDTKERKLQIARAGHPPVIFQQPDGITNLFNYPGSPAIGLLPEANFLQTEKNVGKGVRLLVYSDGVIEAENEEKEMFGIQRLESLVKENHLKPIPDVLEAIRVKVNDWKGEQSYFTDDITCLIMEFL